MLTSSLVCVWDCTRTAMPQLKRRACWLMGIRPTRLTLVVLGVLSVLYLLAPTSVGAAPARKSTGSVALTGTGVVAVGQIDGFKSSPGQFTALLDSLYTDSQWNFYSDGTFAFTPNPDGVGNESYLYPIIGIWQKNNDDTISIKGESAAAAKKMSGGQEMQRLDGVLYEQGGQLLMDIRETDVLGSQQGHAAYTIGLEARQAA